MLKMLQKSRVNQNKFQFMVLSFLTHAYLNRLIKAQDPKRIKTRFIFFCMRKSPKSSIHNFAVDDRFLMKFLELLKVMKYLEILYIYRDRI